MCVYVYMCVCVHTCVPVCVCMSACVPVCVCMSACVCVCMPACVHICVCDEDYLTTIVYHSRTSIQRMYGSPNTIL